jgi:hypothetical protein
MLILFTCQWSVLAAYINQTYDGDGDGGTIGSGFMTLYNNNNYSINANLTNGMGSFSDNLVMFIDTVPGGFTSTRAFSDNGNALETAVSGFKSSRSIANFAPGFAADYAIVVGVDNGAVYKLVDDGSGPHLELVRAGFTATPRGDPNAGVHYFQFYWADLGLPDATTNFFKFETSYINQSGSRAFQSFEGITGKAGFDTITFNNYDTFGVPPIPENTGLSLAIFGGIAASTALVNHARKRCRGASARGMPGSGER